MSLKRFFINTSAAVVLGLSVFAPLSVWAASTTVTTNPADYTPHAKQGNINQYALVGNTMYAGGTISSVVSGDFKTKVTRYNIMAFNALSGQILPFAPNVNGEVWGMEPTVDGKYLYISGAFTAVDGIARRGVVKYDLVNNKVDTSFNANLDARATVVKLVRGQLIIAGSFTKVGTTARTALASVNPNTGAVNPYLNLNISGTMAAGQPTRIYRLAVNPAQDRMVVIGNFTAFGTQSRQQIAMIKLTDSNGVLSSWNSLYFYQNCIKGLEWYSRDVDWSADGSFFVLAATGGPIKNQLCDTASRWDWPSKQSNPASSAPTWINHTGGDSLHSVKVVGDVVYVGGHQRWLDNPEGADSAGPGAVSRPGIGAISATTGKATPWNPTRSRGVGAKELYYTNLSGARGLWVGSDTDQLGYEYHASIGFFPQ